MTVSFIFGAPRTCSEVENFEALAIDQDGPAYHRLTLVTPLPNKQIKPRNSRRAPFVRVSMESPYKGADCSFFTASRCPWWPARMPNETLMGTEADGAGGV
jgi:hypothetical protein